jgi:hypothetical protein
MVSLYFIAHLFPLLSSAECAWSAKVFPRRREHLDFLCRLDDLNAVLHVGRDGIGVAGTKLVLRVARENTDTAREKVAALLVRVRVEWDEVVLTVAHLGDHRLRPDGQQVEGHAEGVSMLGCGGCDDVDHDFSVKKDANVVLPSKRSSATAGGTELY